MTTTKIKKVTPKKSTDITVKQCEAISNNLIGVTDSVLKSLSILAASIVHQAPQFAFQTNQTSVVQLADVFFSYMSGALKVNISEDEAPKFS